MEPQSKTALAQIKDIKAVAWTASTPLPDCKASLHFTEGGLRFDFLFSPRPGTRRLFVLFSGDALRKVFDPPVFQRWTWADRFPGSCLYVSDPCLSIDGSLGLCWYAGTETFDVMEVIADRVRQTRAELGIPSGGTYTYGSSGGGYAAIRALTFLDDAGAIAVNPQTIITDFRFPSVDRYLNHCFGGRSRAAALEDFPRRLSLLNNADLLRGRRILLVQNVLDLHHYERHYGPFCSCLGVGREHAPEARPVGRLLFRDERGHRAAESPAVFDSIMEIATGGA